MSLFENDGCTLFPDQWAGKSLTACCQVHDEAFAVGNTLREFWSANVGLLGCAWQISPLVAIVMFIGVVSPVALALFVFGRKRRSTH